MSELPDLFYASLEEINNGLASDAFSSVDLTLAYVARIREVNPRLNAVLEINAVRTLSFQPCRQAEEISSMRHWKLLDSIASGRMAK